MKKVLFFGISLIFISVFGYSQSITAAWVEGQVQLRSGNSWKDIDIGDELNADAVIRLGRASFAEFSSTNATITLSSEGTYNLSSLVAAGGEQAARRADVVAKMSRIVDRQTPRSTVVAGVRGSFEGAPEKTVWALEDDDPELLAEEARDLIEEGKYQQAAELFGRAAYDSIGEIRDEYEYAQAWSYTAAGNTIEAIKILRGMNPQGFYAIPRVILLSRLNLDTGAANEALELLRSIESSPVLVGDDAELVKELKAEALSSL